MKKHFLPIFAVLILFLSPNAYGNVLTISPQISIAEDYTDNASLRDNATSDFVTTLSPSVDIGLSQKHLDLTLFYDYNHEIYGTETQNNSSRHNAGLLGIANLSKYTTLNFSQRFRRIEDPLREQDLIIFPEDDPYANYNGGYDPDTILRRSRKTYYTLSSFAGLEHQFGDKDFINFSYTYSQREDKDKEGNSNNMHNPGIGLTYWFTPQYGIDARFDYTRGEFEDDDDFNDLESRLKFSRKITKFLDVYVSYRNIRRDYKGDTPDSESDYQIHSSSIGVSYQFDKNTSVSMGGGYFYQKREDEDNEKGLYADVDITKSWKFPRGSFNLSGSSGIDRNETGSENRGFERYYGVMGRLSYGLAKHLTGTLGTSYRRSEFLNSDDDRIDDRFIWNAGISYQAWRTITIFSNYSQSLLYEDSKEAIDGSGSEDNHKTFDIGLTYNPKRWVFITTKYSHSRLNTDLSDEGYEENRASLMVTFVPIRPYRKVY